MTGEELAGGSGWFAPRRMAHLLLMEAIRKPPTTLFALRTWKMRPVDDPTGLPRDRTTRVSSLGSSVPTSESTASPSAVTLIRPSRPVRLFIQKVPFREGLFDFEHLKSPLRKGHFRVFRPVRVEKTVKQAG